MLATHEEGTSMDTSGLAQWKMPASKVHNLSLPKKSAITVSANGGGTDAAVFGRRLRDLRAQVGLSQKQLARSSTLSIRAIRDLENGRVRQPRADTMRLLADALRISAPELHRLANDTPLGSLPGAAEPAANGPFLGREQELSALTTLLGGEHQRVVTVTGIEGVGKTRLVLEAAHALEASQGTRVLWLPLDDRRLRGGQESSPAPDQPDWLREAVHFGPDGLRRLVETIGESNSLLVIDGAGPQDELADLTADLIAACPRLRILVTTRNPADMPLDTLFPLAPLPVPSCGTDPADVASVALLLAQMKRIHPTFRADPPVLADIARICRALDGLPAALESAVHWSLIYSLRQLAEQLGMDPLAVARRPNRGREQADAFASVHHTIASLSDRQRDLLSVMSHTMSGETDGYWSLPELVRETGWAAADCADDIYHLLLLGLLRRVDHNDVAMFTVLNVINVVIRAGHHVPA
jgi:transcriptional regulator with XRE-family HTH domain